MPRGAGRRLSKLLGLLGGVGSGVGSGLLWHIMTVYTDPPRVAILGVEALIGVAVALLLPRSPQTPNLNLIPQLTNAH